MKSLRSTLILFVLAAALGGYIWFNERGPIADKDATVFLRTDPKTLTDVAMEWHGAKVVLRQANGEWQVRHPKQQVWLPADPDAVKTLTDELTLVQSPMAIADEPAKRKDFGLDKPASSLEVAGAKIEFGKSPSFDSAKTYVRVSVGGKAQVGLLPTSFAGVTGKVFDEWRDKAALRVTLEDTKKLVIKAPAVMTVIEKTKAAEDGAPSEWKLTAPREAQGDSSTVESFLTQLPSTKAAKFLDDNPKSLATWQLDKPQATLEVTTAKGVVTLLVGKTTAGGHACKNSSGPAVFEVPASLFGLINRPLRDWRNKTVVKIEADAATKVDIAARGQRKVFAKKELKWEEQGVKAPSTAAEKEAADKAGSGVSDVLFSVGLTATDFIDEVNPAPAKYGFEKPALDLTVDGKTKLLLGVVGDKLYARSGANGRLEETIYVVPKGSIENFKTALDNIFGPIK